MFCNGDINIFVLLLRQDVSPDEFMDSWEWFDEISLPDKKPFYSEFYLWLKNLGDYHDLHAQSDTLLLADVFWNFKSKCIEIYEISPAHFLSASRLVWQACLKKIGVGLELLTAIDVLLMVEKGTWGRICHAIHIFAKSK